MTLVSKAASTAIVVFGAAVASNGIPKRPLIRRLQQALIEAERHSGALVVVTGGSIGGLPAEAHVMRDWLVNRGVAPERIMVEATARSTYENAERCVELLAQIGKAVEFPPGLPTAGVPQPGIRLVILVTESYHMPRGRLLLARALATRGLRVELQTSAAADHAGFGQQLLRRAGEMLKLVRDLSASY